MKYLTSKQNSKIYLLSDTHLIADELHDDGAAFDQMRQTSAGKDLNYQEIALKAFVRKILEEKPTAVIITGDLTFNGAKLSAAKLAEIFSPLQKSKIYLLVIPGNHDIYDGWARKFNDNHQIRVDEISPHDWQSIFAQPYSVAYHQDPHSLSYSVNLNPNYRLILADSNIYGTKYSLTHPITNGRLTQSTLNWIKEELEDINSQHQHALFFMHHNLYSHNDVVHGGFVLDNATDLKKLFKQYNVKVDFAGHIHAQSITGPTKNCPTIEVDSSCFSMTDQGYGIIELMPDRLQYQRYSFEMTSYLTAEEKANLPTDFHGYLKKLFTDTNSQQATWLYEKVPDHQQQKAVLSLINQLNWNFFVGKSNYSDQEIKEISHSKSYQIITAKLPEMKDYLDSLIKAHQDSRNLIINFD